MRTKLALLKFGVIRRRRKNAASDLERILGLPTLLTILIAVSGWGFVYLVESFIAAPLVAYDVEWESSGDGRTVSVSIDNVSRTNRVKNVRIGFASRETRPGKFSDVGMEAIAPAAEGHDSIGKIVSDGLEVQFLIMDLQPSRQFRLWASYSGDDTPELRLLNSDSPVYLYEKGIETWIAKHLIKLVGTLTLGIVAILIVALFVQARQKSREA